MKWYRCPPDFPSVGDKIVVKPVGLKVKIDGIRPEYMYMQVKEGEGLPSGWEEWCYLEGFIKEKE